VAFPALRTVESLQQVDRALVGDDTGIPQASGVAGGMRW
jgi:hypothetical protein